MEQSHQTVLVALDFAEVVVQHLVGLVRSEVHRAVRLPPTIPEAGQDHPIRRSDLRCQSRTRGVGQPRVHLDEVRRRRQLREHVVEEGIAVPRAAQVARPDQQPFARLRQSVAGRRSRRGWRGTGRSRRGRSGDRCATTGNGVCTLPAADRGVQQVVAEREQGRDDQRERREPRQRRPPRVGACVVRGCRCLTNSTTARISSGNEMHVTHDRCVESGRCSACGRSHRC